MKTYYILFIIFCLPTLVVAQQQIMNHGTTAYSAEQEFNEPQLEPVNFYKNTAIPVQQSIGYVYNEKQLLQMARRDINAVASTVAGVDSRSGTNETPSIRGAGPAGTAYFVDGIRVYGALPIISR